MINVKVTLNTGSSYVTGVNAIFDDAKKYFTGMIITDENFETGEEFTSSVVLVEQVQS